MYRIFQGDDLIYAPNLADQGYGVTEPVLSLEINRAGTLEFTMLPNNKMFDEIDLLKGVILLYKDDEVIWHGHPVSIEETFYNRRKVTCNGALDFLHDTLWKPRAMKGFDVPAYNIAEFLIERHNSVKANEPSKLINLSQDPEHPWTGTIETKNPYWVDWENNLFMFQSLLDDFGGYVRCNYNGSGTDMVVSNISGNTINQTIEFGKNLLDLNRYIDVSSIYTAVIPLGKRYYAVERYATRRERPIIINNPAVEVYGYIERTFVLEEYTNIEDIDAPAQEFLQQGIVGAMKLDLKAIDLSVLNLDLDEFKAGVYVPIKSIKHGLDTTILCCASKHHLDDPKSNEYTFGSPDKKYTDEIFDRLMQTKRTTNDLDIKITLMENSNT